jgi:hypothetical protein
MDIDIKRRTRHVNIIQLVQILQVKLMIEVQTLIFSLRSGKMDRAHWADPFDPSFFAGRTEVFGPLSQVGSPRPTPLFSGLKWVGLKRGRGRACPFCHPFLVFIVLSYIIKNYLLT